MKEFKDDVTRDAFYSNIYKLYNCGMVTVCSLLIMFDKLIAKILFAKEFYNGWMYAPFLMISVVFSALMVVMGGVYLATKQSKELGIITVLGAVFNTVLNIILINLVGTIGVAISTMITYIFVWIIRIIRMKQIAKLLINLKRDFFAYFILVLQSVLLFFKINNYLLYGIELLLFWTIIFLYRNDIRHAIEKFFKRRIIYKASLFCKRCNFLDYLLQSPLSCVKICTSRKSKHYQKKSNSIESNFHAKGVRLDVYAKDKKGNAYDIEMQTTKMRELPLRNRYYHSEMDSYQIAEGEKYGNLKHDSCGRFELCRPIFQNLLSCKVEKEAKYFHLLNTLINFLNIYLLRRYIRQRVLHAFFLSFLFIFNEHASPSVP